MGKSCVKSKLWTPSLSLDTFSCSVLTDFVYYNSENPIISIVIARE